MRHVDDFIDDPTTDRYAARWFDLFRRPAMAKAREPNDAKLFCTYRGQRYAVTGCSRMGDAWLHHDLAWTENTQPWYDKRVDVDECSEWSPTAALYPKPGEVG